MGRHRVLSSSGLLIVCIIFESFGFPFRVNRWDRTPSGKPSRDKITFPTVQDFLSSIRHSIFTC